MSSNLFFERLNYGHQDIIENFDCGKDSVNNFLKEEAIKYCENNLVKTRLYFDSDHNLIGFFSLFSESVTIVKSKREQQQWNDIQNEKSIFPSVRLHYLGVEKEKQNQGFGETFLFDAIFLIKEIFEDVGCVFISLETEEDCFKFYKDRNFQYIRKSEHDNNFYDMCLKLDSY